MSRQHSQCLGAVLGFAYAKTGIFQHGDRGHADKEFVFDDQGSSLVAVCAIG